MSWGKLSDWGAPVKTNTVSVTASSGEGRKSAFKIHAESQGDLVAHNESSLLKAKSLAQLSVDTTQMDDHYIQHFTVKASPGVRILSRLYCLQKSFG